jgi:hypothetical protein
MVARRTIALAFLFSFLVVFDLSSQFPPPRGICEPTKNCELMAVTLN